MPQISLRLDQELYDQIESLRGEKERSAFIKELLVSQLDLHCNANDLHRDANNSWGDTQRDMNEIQAMKSETERLLWEIHYRDDVIKLRDGHIKDLQTQLGWMQSQFSRTLIKALPPAQDEIHKKKWWQFWK